jgi:hypothetical protein
MEENQETAPLDDVTKFGTGYSSESDEDDAEQNGLLIIPSKYASSKPNETFSGTVNGKANKMEENKETALLDKDSVASGNNNLDEEVVDYGMANDGTVLADQLLGVLGTFKDNGMFEFHHCFDPLNKLGCPITTPFKDVGKLSKLAAGLLVLHYFEFNLGGCDWTKWGTIAHWSNDHSYERNAC